MKIDRKSKRVKKLYSKKPTVKMHTYDKKVKSSMLLDQPLTSKDKNRINKKLVDHFSKLSEETPSNMNRNNPIQINLAEEADELISNINVNKLSDSKNNKPKFDITKCYPSVAKKTKDKISKKLQNHFYNRKDKFEDSDADTTDLLRINGLPGDYSNESNMHINIEKLYDDIQKPFDNENLSSLGYIVESKFGLNNRTNEVELQAKILLRPNEYIDMRLNMAEASNFIKENAINSIDDIRKKPCIIARFANSQGAFDLKINRHDSNKGDYIEYKGNFFKIRMISI